MEKHKEVGELQMTRNNFLSTLPKPKSRTRLTYFSVDGTKIGQLACGTDSYQTAAGCAATPLDGKRTLSFFSLPVSPRQLIALLQTTLRWFCFGFLLKLIGRPCSRLGLPAVVV